MKKKTFFLYIKNFRFYRGLPYQYYYNLRIREGFEGSVGSVGRRFKRFCHQDSRTLLELVCQSEKSCSCISMLNLGVRESPKSSKGSGGPKGSEGSEGLERWDDIATLVDISHRILLASKVFEPKNKKRFKRFGRFKRFKRFRNYDSVNWNRPSNPVSFKEWCHSISTNKWT